MSAEMEMLRGVLEAQKATRGDGQPSVEQMRAGMAETTSKMPPADGVTEEAIELGGVRGLKFTPDGAGSEAALLYFHGGGYVLGSPETHRGMISHMAKAMGAPAYSMDYRLAPEAMFPAAIEDGCACYAALLDGGQAPGRTIIGGDSAGGGTAVASALMARDKGLPMPAGLALLSPWVNLSNTGWSYKTRAEADPIIDETNINWFADTYLGDTAASDPLASPIHADLTGLPPMLIQVGADEVLLSDSITLAERAGGAGVGVTLEIAPDMIHVWQAFYPFLSEAREAIARIGAWGAETVA